MHIKYLNVDLTIVQCTIFHIFLTSPIVLIVLNVNFLLVHDIPESSTLINFLQSANTVTPTFVNLPSTSIHPHMMSHDTSIQAPEWGL